MKINKLQISTEKTLKPLCEDYLSLNLVRAMDYIQLGTESTNF